MVLSKTLTASICQCNKATRGVPGQPIRAHSGDGARLFHRRLSLIYGSVLGLRCKRLRLGWRWRSGDLADCRQRQAKCSKMG